MFFVVVAYFIVSAVVGKSVNSKKWFNLSYVWVILAATFIRIAGIYFASMTTWPIFIYLWFSWRAYVTTNAVWGDLE